MTYLHSMPAASLVDTFRAYPELAGPLHAFAHNLMRGDQCPLPAVDRELIAAYVSALNGCEFCRESHAAVLSRLGADMPTIDALVMDPAAEAVRPAMRPVLRLARKVNEAPADVAQADVDAVLEAGWDERTVVYAIVVCGFFNLMNRWVDGLGIRSDPAVVDEAARMLAGPGYAAINDLLQR